MHRAEMLAAVAASLLALTAPATHAFTCTPTEGDECRLALGPLTVVFEAGQYSFDGDSQLNGSDGYVTGYTVGTFEFPALTPLDLGGGRFGFSFSPPMSGAVGGSGIEGEHEASASFRFDSLRFEAAPGFRLDDLIFTVTGERRSNGVAGVALNLPGTPVFQGDAFSASGSLPLGSTGFGAGFSAWTVYEEDGEGGAASYGTAFAMFHGVSLVAQVSAVPEPSAWALWAVGVVGAAGLTRRRRGVDGIGLRA